MQDRKGSCWAYSLLCYSSWHSFWCLSSPLRRKRHRSPLSLLSPRPTSWKTTGARPAATATVPSGPTGTPWMSRMTGLSQGPSLRIRPLRRTQGRIPASQPPWWWTISLETIRTLLCPFRSRLPDVARAAVLHHSARPELSLRRLPQRHLPARLRRAPLPQLRRRQGRRSSAAERYPAWTRT